MNKDRNAKVNSSNQQTNGFMMAIERLVAFICVLATFPYANYKVMTDWSDKSNILVRGASVLISPIVGALSLWAYADVVFGDAAFVMILPFIAFGLDWRICGSAYKEAGINRSMKLLRCGLILISFVVAGYAAILSEQPNLQKKLVEVQRNNIINSPEISDSYQQFSAVIKQKYQAITENSKRLQERSTLFEEMTQKNKLADQECSGAATVDKKTGTKIMGGGCGKRAFSHRSDAEAAANTIRYLDTLPAINVQLKDEIVVLKKQQEDLITPHLSVDSTGNLIESAIRYSDWGTKLQIISRLLTLMFFESLALILAHSTLSENLKKAVNYCTVEDALRIANLHQVTLANIQQNHIEERKQFGTNNPPLVIHIPPAQQPTPKTPLH